MTRSERGADRLRAIRDLGVRVAMDDFGTGCTSPALLTRLPLDELKVDRSFAHRTHHQRDRAIVAAVARKGPRLTLVAEDQRTADILRDAGFDVRRGYHFGRPLPPGRLATQRDA